MNNNNSVFFSNKTVQHIKKLKLEALSDQNLLSLEKTELSQIKHRHAILYSHYSLLRNIY